MQIIELFPIILLLFVISLRAQIIHLVADVIAKIKFFKKNDKIEKYLNLPPDYVDLKLIILSEKLVITVRYCNDLPENSKGFSLHFEKTGGINCIRCVDLENEELWVEQVDDSTDLIETGIQKFREILKEYQNKVKKLNIHITCSRGPMTNIDSGITRMNHLKELKVIGEYDVSELLAKTPNTLEKLFVNFRNPEYAEKLRTCEKLYRVQNILTFSNVSLSNSQFLRLSASKIRMDIGQLTVDNIFDLITSWRIGTIRKNVERYEWILTPNFDSIKLFRKFDEMHDGNTNKRIEISHNFEDGKTATLEIIGGSRISPVLYFETNDK